MNKVILCAVLLLPLTSCGSGKAENKEGAAKPQVAEAMKAGQWELTSRALSAQVRKFPAGSKREDWEDEEFKKLLQKVETSKACLTAQQLQERDLAIFDISKDDKCSTHDLDISGGKISGNLTCNENMKVRLAGSYSGEKYDAIADIELSMADDLGMKMKQTITAKRLGECPAA